MKKQRLQATAKRIASTGIPMATPRAAGWVSRHRSDKRVRKWERRLGTVSMRRASRARPLPSRKHRGASRSAGPREADVRARKKEKSLGGGVAPKETSRKPLPPYD